MLLYENETLDDLQFKNLKLIQKTNGFRFGIDAILLSNFAKDIKKNSVVLDLGTGTGIVSTLLCKKTSLSKIYGIEIQEDIADMAKRSILINKLDNQFEIINDNINNLDNYFKENEIDAIVTNPPYKQKNSGLINENQNKLVSRHEVFCSLEDIIKKSSKLLKVSGNFFMVHKPERLVDILYLLRTYQLEPKNIQFVHPNTSKPPTLILIKAVKHGKPFLKNIPNLYIYDKNGDYTKEVLEIYNLDKNI